MKYFLKMGREFTYDNIIKFIDSNLKDLGDVGQDAKFGKGILVLPNVYDLALIDGTITGKIGSNEIKKGEKVITMDVAPFMKDGRTFVPIRFIAETLGKKVEWNNDTQEFTIKGM
jgi:hypothetical protein